MTYISMVHLMHADHCHAHCVACTISITQTQSKSDEHSFLCLTETFHRICPHVELTADHTDATTVDQELLDHCCNHFLTLHQH